MLKTFYINCWRIDNYESEAMWKLYCPQGEGIAIQTTYIKLVDSLPADDEIYFELIKYIDYEMEEFSTNAFSPIMHKRKAFEHEKEIRLIKPLLEHWNSQEIEGKEYGLNVSWDFKSTLENIYVKP